MDMAQTKIVYRRLFLVVISIAGLYFLYRVRIIMVPFIFAFFIAYLLNPMVQFVENKRVPRGFAILTVYLIVFTLLTMVLIFGIPHIIQELNKLSKSIPQLANELEQIVSHIETRYSNYALPEAVKKGIDENIRHVEDEMVKVVKAGTATIFKLFSYILSFVIAPVFAYYMLKDLVAIKSSFVLTIPRKYRSDVMAILRDIDEIISGFLRGHMAISAIVGSLTGLGMYIIGVDFSLIIGFIAAVAELIPYLGPLIAAVPAVSLALLVSKKTAVYAFIVILIVQQLENAVISPKILGSRLGLHPLVIIFAVLSGGELYGLAGLLLAVPVTAILKVIFRYVYLKLVDEN